MHVRVVCESVVYMYMCYVCVKVCGVCECIVCVSCVCCMCVLCIWCVCVSVCVCECACECVYVSVWCVYLAWILISVASVKWSELSGFHMPIKHPEGSSLVHVVDTCKLAGVPSHWPQSRGLSPGRDRP